MKINLCLAAIGAILLSACGGGGGLSGLDNSYRNTGTNSNEVVKQFSDGSAVVATKGNLKSLATIEEPSYFFSITDAPDSLIETFNGAMNLEVVQADDFGGTDYYRYVYTGTNSQGKTIEAISLGYFLDGSGNQVSVNIATLNQEELFFFTAGTLAKMLPSGKHTYSAGNVGIVYKDSGFEDSYDQITVAVDFDTKTGSLVAETDSYFVSADGFIINTSNGTFQGSDATIGLIGGANTLAADIIGGFSGVGAEGIHGLVYSDEGDFGTDADSCLNCGVASFYALKN